MNITISNENLFNLNKQIRLRDTRIEELERLLQVHQELCFNINKLLSIKEYTLENAVNDSGKLVQMIHRQYNSTLKLNAELHNKVDELTLINNQLKEDYPK